MSNLSILTSVAIGLGHLCPSVVFVGGSVTELYATDGAAPEVRTTDDVDCVIELVSYTAFTHLEEELRSLKFKNDSQSKVICRWIYDGIKVDIMPNDSSVIGFTNPWYIDGMRKSINYPLEKNLTIRIFASPWFLASKMVAFSDRGKYDFRISSDFEDIIYVLDNRQLLLDELRIADEKVKKYLKSEFQKYLLSPLVSEGIFCALPYGSGSERIHRIKSIMGEIAEL